ncbi:MAG: sugar ABC transporter permease [Verrucomicrobia bacterium]|nr:MAG: sugar ABC transporter permease [Verrucomicrobiota bacterium]
MSVVPLARGEPRSSQITVIQPRRLPRLLGALATYVGMTLLAGIFLVPLLFEFIGSIKPNDRVLSEGNSWRAFIPTSITFVNYGDALARADLARLFINSMIITSSIVVAGIVVNSLFGYALARMTFRGRGLLVGVVIALIIIPFQAIAVPLFFMMAKIEVLDTYQVQIVPFIASPFFTYLFYTFFLSIPKELEEAARVDGAGPLTIFWRVVVPLARPVYATVELLWPVLVTRGPEVRPLPLGIAVFQTLPPVQWGDIMAFATVMTLPLLVVFLAFQDAFVRSVARTGIKG